MYSRLVSTQNIIMEILSMLGTSIDRVGVRFLLNNYRTVKNLQIKGIGYCFKL